MAEESLLSDRAAAERPGPEAVAEWAAYQRDPAYLDEVHSSDIYVGWLGPATDARVLAADNGRQNIPTAIEPP
jgi:hypothetical protein